jgi:hypothetical protein
MRSCFIKDLNIPRNTIYTDEVRFSFYFKHNKFFLKTKLLIFIN